MLVRWLLHGGLVLEIVRDDDTGDGPFRHRDPHGAVDQVPDLLRFGGDFHERAGHILEERRQVHFLLEMAALRHLRYLPDDGDDRLVVQPGIVEAVEQMDRAGSLRRQADTHLAREAGMAGRHQRGRLFVANRNVGGLVAGSLQGPQNAVDAIAGVPENPFDPPLAQLADEDIAGCWCVRHRLFPGLVQARVTCRS